ncbi:hypothetical protein LSUE1_G002222 [Lachnellula suecica]|uniref:Uncharacterized protein n=1 Tax=Lachnellula suecica TaxID=602035 RepID=A0A8T9CEN2_9HELO|nr:hypothetical protein LSUE1_G002222 [Lachnellula suecica]
MLFGFLDDWLNNPTTTAKDKSRLHERLLSELSDLAAINEILSAKPERDTSIDTHGDELEQKIMSIRSLIT